MSAGTPTLDWRSILAPPRLELEPLAAPELALFRGGELQSDVCEAVLASAARVRGALEVAIAEGLDALRRGDRLAELGCHLDDYAREVLDLGERAAEELARLGRELRSRPLLREALRAGRVRLRAAQILVRVPAGDAEARWVERAERCTVRELEALVASGGAPPEEDEPWLRLRTCLRTEERDVLEGAEALAAEVMSGASRLERLEAMAQEFAGTFPIDPDARPASRAAFRPMGPREAQRAARLEAETERWCTLREVVEVPAPEVTFDEAASAAEVDATLRELARCRAGWDDVVGYCAAAVKDSGLFRLLGFASFRQYCHERLGVGARTVEERSAVEKRRRTSAALEAAKRRGLPFEKLRLLARLPEAEIEGWIERAEAMTCIALRRALQGEAERQMRAHRQLAVALPVRVAEVVAAAVQAVRDRVRRPLPFGTCLAIVAAHFVETWRGAAPRSRSPSQKVRDRDGGHCVVPGCSHRATHAHHVLFRSQGGGDDAENQIALCAFHHLRCIHGGFLRVVGRAPAALRWFLNGAPWAGPRAVAR